MAVIDAVGLDGTKGGWAVVCLSAGVLRAGYVAQSFREVVEAHPDANVAVDMPLGLEDAPVREADEAARAPPGRDEHGAQHTAARGHRGARP